MKKTECPQCKKKTLTHREDMPDGNLHATEHCKKCGYYADYVIG